jgi:hypothetical protein
MASNVYVDKASGEKVSIINDNADFYVLNNSVSIKKDVFARKYEPQVEVDPNSFFNNSNYSTDPLLNIANQIRNIDSSKINESQASGAHVKYTPPVILADTSLPPGGVIRQPQMEGQIVLSAQEKRAMLEQYNREHPNAQMPIPEAKDWDQEEERLLNGEVENPQDPFAIQAQESRPRPPKPETFKPEPKVDPMQMMFKMFKSNYPVTLNVEIKENIPNPTFIGMIQENVETDAIEYYAKLISDKLLKDPEKLKTEVYNQLKSIINKELGIEEEEKKEE